MKNEQMQNLLDAASGLSGNMREFSARGMGPWQILGFFAGCTCGGIEVADADTNEWLAADLLDEIARLEDDDEPRGFEEGPPAACIERLAGAALELFGQVAQVLAEEEGALDPGFAATLEKTGGKDASALAQAREYCRGLLRGIPFAVEDEEELEEEQWSEPVGLLFVLAEDDLGPGFGSVEELRQARISVASNLAGLTAQLYGNLQSE